MTIKVYRENEAVFIYTAVANFQQKNIVERTAKAKSVSAAVLETLQYKTAIHAKNEFEAYLNSAFADAGDVVQKAKVIPPPPPFKLPEWLEPDIQFELALTNYPFFLGASLSPFAFIFDFPFIVFNFYFLVQLGFPFNDKEYGISTHIGLGYLLRYNDYFYIPLEIGGSFSSGSSFTFSTGVMKIWKLGRESGLTTTVKINIGATTENCLNNMLMISVGYFKYMR
jgi:hypothetical protein